MVTDDRCVKIPLDAVGAGACWLLAFALMLAGTMGEITSFVGWGLLASAAAATWTVATLLVRTNTSHLESVAMLLRMRDETDNVPKIDRGPVRR